MPSALATIRTSQSQIQKPTEHTETQDSADTMSDDVHGSA